MTMTLTILTLTCKGHQPFIFCFLHKFWINWYTTFIIYQREPQLKAKTHYLSITHYLQRAVPVLIGFQLNYEMEERRAVFHVSFDGQESETDKSLAQDYTSLQPELNTLTELKFRKDLT